MVEMLARLLAPVTPHLAEEVWATLGHEQTIFDERWPEFDEAKAREDFVIVAVQINGKLRDTFSVMRDAPQEELMRLALDLEKVKPHVDGKQVVKTIVVPNKIVNIVVK